MVHKIIYQIMPASIDEALQLEAAQQVLVGDFKGAISSMRASLGLEEGAMPGWAHPLSAVHPWMTGQQKGIGNAFVYRRVLQEKYGLAACSVLKGDYGIAAYLMFEYEWKQKFPMKLDEIPEDLEELLLFLEKDQTEFCANDPLWPSWL